MRKLGLLLLLFCAVLFTALAQGEEQTTRTLRLRFPTGASVYFEIPDINALVKSMSSTSFAKVLQLPESKDLLEKSSFANRVSTLVTQCSQHNIGMAVGIYPDRGFRAILQSKDAKGVWEALKAFDPMLAEAEPVKNKENYYRHGEDWLYIGDDIIVFSSTSVGIEESAQSHKQTVADDIKLSGGTDSEKSGFYLYIDAAKLDMTKIFDGYELTTAAILGLTSLGAVHWSGHVENGMFVEKATFKPSGLKWKGLAAAALFDMPIVFDERLTESSLARLSLSLPVRDAFNSAVDALPPDKKKQVEQGRALFRIAANREIEDELASAFSGSYEVSVLKPDLGFLPHIAVSIGVKEKSSAQTFIELINSRLFEFFPLSNRTKDSTILYRTPSKRLGIAPCLTFTKESVLMSDSIPFLKTLVKRSPIAFPSPNDTFASRLPGSAIAAFYADNQSVIKWLIACIPLVQTVGVTLPFDPALLPSPDDAAGFFTASTGSIRAERGDLKLDWHSDAPLLGALTAIWITGRIADIW